VLGARELLLDDAYRVVTEVAGQPTREARQTGPQRDLELSITRPPSSNSVLQPSSRMKERSARRAARPMNEYRPKRSPPTTDSSRKVLGSLASFRYSESGVSRSAKLSAITGMRL
jgi:hypothetical protein